MKLPLRDYLVAMEISIHPAEILATVVSVFCAKVAGVGNLTPEKKLLRLVELIRSAYRAAAKIVNVFLQILLRPIMARNALLEFRRIVDQIKLFMAFARHPPIFEVLQE
tara:strand:+ start:13088 stop:13414 length:327 start_codon:yes stop_codon:yes gene_type:complete